MAIYIVQARDAASLDAARFVREGFSWPAFAFAQLWLLFHRLWLALVLWLAFEAIFFVVVFPHLPLGAALLVDLVTRIWLGCEAGRLRLDKGSRRTGLTAAVEARDRDEAEALFFRERGAVPETGVPEMGAP